MLPLPCSFKAFSFMHFVPELFPFRQITIASVERLAPRDEGHMLGMVRLALALPLRGIVQASLTMTRLKLQLSN